MNRNYQKGYDSDRVTEAFRQSEGSKMYRRQNKDLFDAIATKMVRGVETEDAIQDNETILSGNNDTYAKTVLSKSVERIRNNQNTTQLLPDMRMAIELIIGGILSPKDFVTTELTYSSNSKVFKDIAGPLLDVIRDYFTSTYKLKDKLAPMLYDILARTGSYPIAVLPETTVDYLINKDSRVTLESLKSTLFTSDGQLQHAGILPSYSFDSNKTFNETSVFDLVKSFESGEIAQSAPAGSVALGGTDAAKFGITLTDNFDVLKLPSVSRLATAQVQQQRITARVKQLRKHVNQKISYSEETYTITNGVNARSDKDKEALAKLYPEREFKGMPLLKVKPRNLLDKPTVGHPIEIKLPTECLIPIHSPNDPSDHIDYLAILDTNGVPLRMSEIDSIYRSLSQSTNGVGGLGGSAVGWALQYANQQVNGAQNMGDAQRALMAIERAVPLFRQTIENDLLDRISRGALGSGISLASSESIWTLMLMRAFAGRNTQILYIPGSMVSYNAIDYDEFGLGKTILDDSETLAGLRSLQMFANSMAATKNAITRRVLRAQIDPAEKNPQRAREIIMHEYAKGTSHSYPLTNSPVDQVNYLQMAGLSIDIDEHPLLPNTKFSVEYIDNDYQKIDTEYDDWLRRMHILSTGISPDVIDSAGGADFATQVLFSNVITNRRMKGISDRFCIGLSGHVRRYTYNSQILMDKLIKLIKDSGKQYNDQFGELMTTEDVAIAFLETIEVKLPVAELEKTKEQKENYEAVREYYEMAINDHFSEDFLTDEELGRLGENGVEGTKAFLLSRYMRHWMVENGIMTELFDLTAKDDDGNPLIDILKEKEEYLDAISTSLLEMATRRFRRKDKLNKQVDKLEKRYGAEDEGGGSDYDSGGNNEGGDDDLGGFGDPDSQFDDPDDTSEGDGENKDGQDGDDTDQNTDDKGDDSEPEKNE